MGFTRSISAFNFFKPFHEQGSWLLYYIPDSYHLDQDKKFRQGYEDDPRGSNKDIYLWEREMMLGLWQKNT